MIATKVKKLIHQATLEIRSEVVSQVKREMTTIMKELPSKSRVERDKNIDKYTKMMETLSDSIQERNRTYEMDSDRYTGN